MKTESFETLGVGRKYLSREGKVVKIKSNDKDYSYPFKGDDHCSYAPDGRWVFSTLKSKFDLISRIITTTLTIQRWGVLWRYESSYQFKQGKLVSIWGENVGPFLFRTRKQARDYALVIQKTKVVGRKHPKAVKVRCTYEVIE